MVGMLWYSYIFAQGVELFWLQRLQYVSHELTAILVITTVLVPGTIALFYNRLQQWVDHYTSESSFLFAWDKSPTLAMTYAFLLACLLMVIVLGEWIVVDLFWGLPNFVRWLSEGTVDSGPKYLSRRYAYAGFAMMFGALFMFSLAKRNWIPFLKTPGKDGE